MSNGNWSRNDRIRKHKLLTQEILKKLPPLYSTEDQGDNAEFVVKFFTPDANWTWYAKEYDPEEELFFGLVDGFEKEWGYFSLEELESITGAFGLPIERDMYWGPKKVWEVKKAIGMSYEEPTPPKNRTMTRYQHDGYMETIRSLVGSSDREERQFLEVVYAEIKKRFGEDVESYFKQAIVCNAMMKTWGQRYSSPLTWFSWIWPGKGNLTVSDMRELAVDQIPDTYEDGYMAFIRRYQ